MVALTTVVAVAVVCAVVVIVGIVVGTVVWVKKRQDRLSLALVNARQGPYGLQNFPVETLTELSREEGSQLRQYGQLPYGRPSEWDLLKSHDSLVSPVDSEPGNFSEKRPLRRSFSWSRSIRHLQNPLRPLRGSSLAPLAESNKEQLSPKRTYEPQDKILLSAVEGVLELPTETTPRHTPERDDERHVVIDPTIRPISSNWPVYHTRERSGNLFPLLEDRFEGYGDHGGRPRGGSITLQTPGDAPAQPAPPPPCAYPPNRFRLSKNDSVRFSTLSLETADSSILDDSRRTSGLESNFASPSLPPCPTFTPYSANDVGRIEYDRRGFTPTTPAFPAPFIFPAVSPSRESQRLESRDTSPRRSQTARSPSHSTERICTPPRRSESLQSRRDVRSSSQYSPIHVPPLNVPNRDSLVPHFSQMQQSQRRNSSNNDPFSSSGMLIHPHALARRSNSFLIQGAQIASNGYVKPPLASALKGGNGPRKGHKRQNCVRISIHPPITFGGPTFSPMVEEPEEFDDLGNIRRSDISYLSAPNLPHINSLNSSVSSLSMGRSSYQDLHSSYYYQQQQQQRQMPPPQRPQPSRRGSDVPPASRSTSYRESTRKKRHRRTQSADNMTTRSLSNRSTQSLQTGSSANKSLPELLTNALPPPTTAVMEASLSSTPSPEKKPPPVWMGPPNYASSPTTYENISPGSPRRSAVKGPRSQPSKPARPSVRSMALQVDTKVSTAPMNNNNNNVWSPPSSASDRSPGRRNMGRASARESSDSLQRKRSAGAPPPMPPPAYQQQQQQQHLPHADSNGQLQDQPDPEPISSLEDSQNSRQIVPIWEDRKLERHPTTKSTVSVVSQLDGPAELQGDVSPMHLNRNRSWKFTTPTKKAVGLGIGAATPGSLYDRDGFLKE
ncbi:hypothetical protein FE257_004811 [Aspergillus nanangensis]|uniref:Uncharacterized protein n=1 Tax=Aspergillus nanangensis TaxID=2582783 RepID=A0AAD4CRR7_ASPNN|nr:hypothetical protein FE257_004811 [Aspergillus nanangensis]